MKEADTPDVFEGLSALADGEADTRVGAAVSAAWRDDAAVRAAPSIERTEKLKQAFEDWTSAGGNDAGRQLIHRAQGVIGLINVTDPRDGAWAQVMSDLSRVKRDWSAVKP